MGTLGRHSHELNYHKVCFRRLPPTSLGSPEITRSYIGQNEPGAGKEGVFDWFDICGPFAGEDPR
jgi:hypothetical protein